MCALSFLRHVAFIFCTDSKLDLINVVNIGLVHAQGLTHPVFISLQFQEDPGEDMA